MKDEIGLAHGNEWGDRWVIRKMKGENKAIKERKRWERESVSKKTKVHIMKWITNNC